jgi:hypothetical protein
MNQNKIWFWDDKYNISHGSIAWWVNDNAYIRTYNGYSINLPMNRLFNTEEDCLRSIRELKLKQVLNKNI